MDNDLIRIQIDEKVIREYIKKQIDKEIHYQLLLVDVNKLSEITSMSNRYLEDEFLRDPRIKMHERKKNWKRWWLYEPTVEAIKNIVDEW